MEKPLDRESLKMYNPMNKLIKGISIICIASMTPFAINHIIQSRYIMCAIVVIIISIFVINTVSISKHNRYYPNLILFGLAPAALFFLVVSIRKLGVGGAVWCYPAIVSFYFMLPKRKAWIVNAVILAVTFPVLIISFDSALSLRIIVSLILISISSAMFIDVITDQQNIMQNKNNDLQTALSEIKTLSGLLPICSHCKAIRDDKGYWHQIETYIDSHSEASFSHGICKGCAKKHYPEFDLYKD